MNRRRPRVAHVIAATAGARWMVEMCAGLRDRGWDVIAIVDEPGGPLAEELERHGIPCLTLSQNLRSGHRYAQRFRRLGTLFHLAHVTRNVVRMALLLRRRRIDVLHSHLFPTLMIARVAGWLARVPVRVSMTTGPWHLHVEATRWIDRLTAWMDHQIIVSSIAIGRKYDEMALAPAHRRLVYYGPDAARFDPSRVPRNRLRAEYDIASDADLVGQIAVFHGRVDHWLAPPEVRGKDFKGHDTFVHAARLVLERRPNTRFVLVGDGPTDSGRRLFDETRALVRDLGLENAVIFTGRVSEVPVVLADLDVAVQCPRHDNVAGTIESLLMEVPTVATEVGGLTDSVLHEETGLLVPPDDPLALAAAICRLLEDREHARRLARAGRRRMLSGFTLADTVDGVEATYRDLARGALAGRARSPGH